LQGIARAVEFLGAVAHGLPVRADGPYGAGGDAAVFQQPLHYGGVDPCQRIARQGRTVQFVGARGVECE